ncbi:ABC transporter ATP-binding protein [Candidatus Pacearchaeota archaeon]|nr:ABC transporter ATP-binding protein [Candidatus Pacearchaeota archaeon]
MAQGLITLKEVTKYYYMGDSIVKAVDGISIKIQKGDFVAIMGPSGSGKSTAMNLVGSLDLATEGKIMLEGEDIRKFSESELAKLRGKKIGFIFQSFNLIPNLTALENVMLPMLFQNIEKEERIKRGKNLLKIVELGERMNHYPAELSGGQQQRVAIARALANDPEIILADEPTGNLDTKTGENVMNLLVELNNKGKTIILITHSHEVATKHAKKIYWLKDGKVEKVTTKKGISHTSKK